MAFVSLYFLIFVLFVTIFYFIVPCKWRWIVLLCASYAFYLISSPKTLIFLVITTITTFFGAKKIGLYDISCKKKIKAAGDISRSEKKLIKADFQKKKKFWMLTVVCFNFAILACLKYFRENVEGLLKLVGFDAKVSLGILIPLGISFYTFQSVGYLIDVYGGACKPDKNLAKFALFVSFFPQIIQGPISRYDQLAGQLYEGHKFDYTRIKFGAQLILWGFFKKLVVADRIRILVDQVFDNHTEYQGFFMVIAVVGYTIQIYADFSGGIDIARGVAQILGINMVNNFERPYFSCSIIEFWQRWHITLGSWCRDYIFYPISLSPTFGKLGKRMRGVLGDRVGKLVPVIIAQLVTFFVIGLWHGADWKFIAYGFYQAIFIVGSILLEPQLRWLIKIFRVNEKVFSWKVFRMCRTFILIVIGRFFSRGGSFIIALTMMKKSLVFNPRVFFDGSLLKLGLTVYDFRILGISLLVWLGISIMQESGMHLRETLAKQNLVFRWFIYLAAFFAVLIFGVYGPGYDAAAFIYRGF